MKGKKGKPSDAEYGQTIAYMVRQGMTGKEAQNLIGKKPNGRSRKKIADDLRAELKKSPKAKKISIERDRRV